MVDVALSQLPVHPVRFTVPSLSAPSLCDEPMPPQSTVIVDAMAFQLPVQPVRFRFLR
jgi:hypothetical protein